jgi:hypothetical protein
MKEGKGRHCGSLMFQIALDVSNHKHWRVVGSSKLIMARRKKRIVSMRAQTYSNRISVCLKIETIIVGYRIHYGPKLSVFRHD